ncbi:biotin carboxylase [Prauserella sediminis]|uniref:Biotin carboxylase n=2 Tax=Prauserella salsuginis group TaxID=2893672 RepID=A0A839XNA3_9PSEU|nr:ATP-grasp domain-containing protein [Prauserella sediminis]MBB3664221.1 biotin carboxylase [Prauserella sediminis]
MKTLVVLGGADGSVSVYQRARGLGYRTICVDIRPSAPGVLHADEFVQLSVRAPERIASALAGRDDIVGVLCPASDVGLPALAWLTRHWNLPASLPDLAMRASVDKSVFRELCAELDLPGYRAVSGTPDDDLVKRARELRFPALVKPVDSSGSRGVVACAGPGFLRSAFAESVAFSPEGKLVVEEYVTGMHLTVEVLMRQGSVAFHAVTERTITPPPYFVTTSHLVPAELPSGVDAELVGMLEAVCERIDYPDGPLTLDAVLGRDGRLYLVEMGARMGGNGLAELIESCYGVDVMAATMATAMGDEPVLASREPVPTMVQVFGADRAGRLAEVCGIEEVRSHPAVVDLRLFADEGTFVRAYEQAGYKLGYAVLQAPTMDDLRAAAEAVRGALKFRLDDVTQAVP